MKNIQIRENVEAIFYKSTKLPMQNYYSSMSYSGNALRLVVDLENLTSKVEVIYSNTEITDTLITSINQLNEAKKAIEEFLKTLKN